MSVHKVGISWAPMLFKPKLYQNVDQSSVIEEVDIHIKKW